MKLLIFIFIVIAVIVSLKAASHKPVVVEDIEQYQCGQISPMTEVASHFKHPFYAQVIQKYAVSEVKEDSSLVISGYTWWGIEVNRALYSCKDGIKTLKSF